MNKKYLFAFRHYSDRKLLTEKEMLLECVPKNVKKFSLLSDAEAYCKPGQWVSTSGNDHNILATHEGHASFYYYGQEMEDYMSEHDGSTKGYDGPVYSHWFPADSDKRDDVEGCALALIPMLEYFKEHKIIHQLYFSGSKGFHWYIPDGYISYPPEMEGKKNLVYQAFFRQLAKQFPTIETVKDLGIYSKNHLLRVPFSLHGESSRLKMHITYKGYDPAKPWHEWFIPTETSKDIAVVFKNMLTKPQNVTPLWTLDMSLLTAASIPKRRSNFKYKFPYMGKACIYKILEEGIATEGRHNTAMRILGWAGELSLPEKAAYDVLADWNSRLDQPRKDRELVSEMKAYGTYHFSCNDSIKMANCTNNNTCYYFKSKQYQEDVQNAQAGYDRYKKQTLESTATYIHMDKYWKGMRFTLRPTRGHILTIVGASGVGKTILMMLIMLKANHINWLFFSYEMGEGEINDRFALMLGLDREIPADAQMFIELTKHIFIEDKGNATAQMHGQIKRATEAKYGIQIHGLGCDYVQITPVSDPNDPRRYITHPTQAVSTLAKVAKDTAKKENIVYIFAAQPTKGVSQNGNTPLDEEDARDGQAVQAMSDGIMTMWRPLRKTLGHDRKPMPDIVTTLCLPKWRHGAADFEENYKWNAPRCLIGGVYKTPVTQRVSNKYNI